ncbi:MAG: lamin tail domain-containing protein [Candidatus Moraniibacteriota bacterium]
MQLSCTITIALATAGLAHAKERPHVRLSEVLVEDGNSRNEYVELINLDDEPADIGSWQLRRYTTRQSTNPDSKTFSKDACLPGHGHYLWANSEGKYAELADETTKSFSLAKDNGLALYTSSKDDADLIDSLSWGKGYPFDEDAAHFEDNPEDGEAFVYDLDDKKLKKSTDLSPTKKEGACQKESEPEEEPSQPVEGVFSLRNPAPSQQRE